MTLTGIYTQTRLVMSVTAVFRQLPQAILSLEYGAAIEPDTIILPESVVEDLTTPVGRILNPLFDLVWNALRTSCVPELRLRGQLGQPPVTVKSRV